MISKLFVELQQIKDTFLRANSGQDFEDRIGTRIRALGYSRALKEDIDKKRFIHIKNEILKKEETTFLDVESSETKTYITQPFGSQQYPDILIFTEKKIIPIEVKYSNKNKSSPIWNSNLPKANGLYIFGSYNLKDITFFCGKDVLSMEERSELINFFEDVKSEEKRFRTGLRSLNDKYKRGFSVYIRRAYEQKLDRGQGAHLNYFNHPERNQVEQGAIDLLKMLEK